MVLSRSDHDNTASCASNALRTLVYKDDTAVLSLQLLESSMNLSKLFLLANAAVPEVSCGAIELLATMVERGVMPFEATIMFPYMAGNVEVNAKVLLGVQV